MLIDDILPTLGLPESTVKQQWFPKKTLLAGGCRHPGDKNRIVSDIVSLCWLALINTDNSRIPPRAHSEFECREISILAVVVRPGINLEQLAEAIHSALASPVILFFIRDKAVIEISVAHKVQSPEFRNRTIISGEPNHCPLHDTPVDVAFLASVSWQELPKQDMFAVYDAWFERISALKAARLTDEFELCATVAESVRRDRALEDYVRHFQGRKSLRKRLAEEYVVEDRMAIRREIERMDARIEALRESLRSKSDGDATGSLQEAGGSHG